MAAAREREAALEAALREDLPALTKAQDTLYQLGGLRERLRGTQSLAAERMRNAAGATEAALEQGRDPDELEAEAERVRAEEQEIGTQVEAHRGALEEAVTARRAAEDAAAEAERRVAGLQRAAADRREGLARLHGQVNALKSRAAAADDEIGRLGRAREDVLARAERAQRDFTALETRVAGLDAGEEGLDAEHEAAVAALDDIEDRLAKAREEALQADRDRSTLAARKDALEMGLNRKDGAGALLAASDQVSGLLGSVAALLTVRSGYEAAVASALGSAADAVAVTDADAAVAAIGRLKDDDLGPRRPAARRRPRGRRRLARAARRRDVRPRRRGVPRHAAPRAGPAAVQDRGRRRPARRPRPGRRGARRHRRHPRRRRARRPLRRRRLVRPAEPDRDPGGGRRGRRRSWPRPSRPRSGWASTCPASRASGWRRRSASTWPSPSCTSPTPPWRPSPRSSASSAPRPGPPAARPSAWSQAIEQAEAARDQDLAGLADLEQRLAAAEEAPEEEPDTGESERLAEAAKGRPAGRDGGPPRAAHLGGAGAGPARPGRPAGPGRRGRARGPGPRRRAPRAADPRGPGRRGGRHRGRPGAAAARGVDPPRHRAAAGGRAGTRRPRAGAAHRARPAARARSRARRAGQLRPPRRDGPHPAADAHRADRGEGARGARARRRRTGRRLRTRHTSCRSPGRSPRARRRPSRRPFVREEQQKRLRTAERALAQLGRINPLALEEFSAMEERHKFLTEQLEDLKATRKDLLDIVREVDQRVEEVFTEAYADVSKAFDETFSRLFPGGEGRLILTEPGDMLTTGVEVEARPAGQEGQAAVAAVRWRAVAGRGRVPGRAVQGPALAVLHPRRGRGRARRHQPRPAAGDLRGAARPLPAAGDHPPEAHHGGRRRALRRVHARRRREHGDQPAPPRSRAGVVPDDVPQRSRLRRLAHRHDPRGPTTTSTGT